MGTKLTYISPFAVKHNDKILLLQCRNALDACANISPAGLVATFIGIVLTHYHYILSPSPNTSN